MLEFLMILAFAIPGPQAIKLTGGTVTGVLRTNEGAPMTSVRVAVVPADGTDAGSVLQAIAETDSDGRYRMENVPPGRYHIMTGRIDSPLFHPGVDDIRRATTIVVADGSTTQVAEMLFIRTRISGRVVDAVTGLGRRIESLSVCCDYSLISSRAGFLEVAFTPVRTPVHDDGHFEFSAVSAGNQYFQVFDPEIVSFNLPITVSNEDQTGIELKASSGSEIRGRLVDQTGTPIGQALISLRPQPGNRAFEIRGRPLDGPNVMSANTLASGASPLKPATDDIQARLQLQAGSRVISLGANGIFSIPGVLPGAYVLEISPPGSNTIRREVEVGAQVTNIQIELPFTQIAGRVFVKGDGTPPALKDSVRVFIYGADGRVSFCLPGEDGRFYQVLSPGEYRVEAHSLTSNYSVLSISDGTRDLSAQPIVLERDGSPEIRITLELKER
jgi:hypothetical protein